MPIIKPSRTFEGSDLFLGAMSQDEIREAVEKTLAGVTWISEAEGFCACPGAHLHTTRDADKDCKIYLDPAPTISCFHSSCRVMVEETTRSLRQLVRERGNVGKKKLTPEEKALVARIKARESLRRQSATSRHRILRDFEWTYEQMLKDSPERLPSDPGTHWREQAALFEEGDVIWIGHIYQSGKPEHSARFRTQKEWLESCNAAPALFTCGSTFQRGSYARANSNLVRRAFLIVESDELDRNTIGGVFRWLKDRVGLSLRCIVDTAGKSLHGWFKFPAEEELDDLRIILPELGCDPKMFTPSQPCRLAGAIRDGSYQKLIYLQKEVQS